MQTIRFFWLCRENGTHLFDYALPTSAEWIGACLKTYGGEPHCQLAISINLDMDDYVKRELRYLDDKDKRVQGSFEITVIKDS